MTLEEIKNSLKKTVERCASELHSAKIRLEKLENCEEIAPDELFNGIEKFIDLKLENKEYEHILGGDGRSQPYSEKRIGTVATISVKSGYYANDVCREVIRDYVTKVYKPDDIVFYHQ